MSCVGRNIDIRTDCFLSTSLDCNFKVQNVIKAWIQLQVVWFYAQLKIIRTNKRFKISTSTPSLNQPKTYSHLYNLYNRYYVATKKWPMARFIDTQRKCHCHYHRRSFILKFLNECWCYLQNTKHNVKLEATTDPCVQSMCLHNCFKTSLSVVLGSSIWIVSNFRDGNTAKLIKNANSSHP